eukprot:8208621-Ditylum_brightwellii.AAC.1
MAVTISYNGSLALYYLLLIKYSWPSRRLRKIEKWFHIVPFVSGLLFMIVTFVQSGGNATVALWTGICRPLGSKKQKRDQQVGRTAEEAPAETAEEAA